MNLILIIFLLPLSSIFASNLHTDKNRFFGFNKQNAIYSKGNSIYFSYLKNYDIEETLTPYYSIKSKIHNYEDLKIEFIGADFSHIIGTNNSQYNLFNFGSPNNNKYFCNDSVIIKNIYNNISLRIKENNNNYEFIFELDSGANINDIKIKLENGYIDEDNNLISNNFIITNSIAYYKNNIANKFKLNYKLSNNIISYEDNIIINSKLIIDPIVLLQGTYFGGSAIDRFYDMDVDSNNNTYSVGLTSSTAQIAYNGYQQNKSNGFDAIIVKFDSTGKRMWASYFGGNGDDIAFSTKIKNNNILIAGRMQSNNFTMSQNAHQKIFGGEVDGFFANFNQNGTLYYSTYFGGEGDDAINGIDSDGESILISGYTKSKTNIASGGRQNTNGGGYDAFLAKFDDTSLDWGTYLGGKGDDFSNNIVYNNNIIIITGSTNSSDNISLNGYQNKIKGGYDSYFSEFKLNGDLVRSSYFGGTSDDFGFAIDNYDNDIYLLGSGNSVDLPTNTFQKIIGGENDGFIAKIKQDTLLNCTYFGGENYESVYDIKYNDYLYIVGGTRSDSNITYNSTDKRNGDYDAFFLKTDRNLNPVYSTYLGGDKQDIARAININDNIIIAGYTASSNTFFKNGFQNINNGNTDAFISKFMDDNYLKMSISLTGFPCSRSEKTISINKNFNFNNNNSFNIYLSDINGEFSKNNLIYSVNSSDTIITFLLPKINDYSEKYKLKVVSSSPYCSTISDSFTIYPDIQYKINKTLFCKDDILKASIIEYPNSTIKWSLNDTLLSNNDSLSYNLANLKSNIGYVLKLEQITSNCHYETGIIFFIKDYPEVELVGDTNVCIGEIKNYYYTTNSKNNPEIIVNGGIITSQNSNSFTVEWNNTNSYINFIFKDNSEFCGLNKRFDINSFKIENVNIIGNDTTCVECIEDYYIENKYDKYKWEVENGELLTSDTLNYIRVKWLNKNGNISVKYSKNNCDNTSKLNLLYLDEPILNISPNILNVCLNDEIRFITSDAEFLSFTWNVLNATILENNNNNILVKFDNNNSATINLFRKNNLNNKIDTISKILNVIEFDKQVTGLKDSLCFNENLIVSTNIENTLNISTTPINIINQNDNSINFKYLENGLNNLNIKIINKLTGCSFEIDTLIYIIPIPEPAEISIFEDYIMSNHINNLWYENDTLVNENNSNKILAKENHSYYAFSINEFNCFSDIKSNIINYKTNSISNNKITIYPNPNKGEFVIDLDKYYDNLNIEVIDLLGNRVFNEINSGNKFTLNLKIKNGFYFIKIHSNTNLIYFNKFYILN